MPEQSIPDPSQARASLKEADESRQAAVKAAGRPAGIDLGLAVVSGTGITLGLLGQWIAALLIVVVGCTAIAVLQRRIVRRRGQVIDQKALGARAWRFALIYAALLLLTMIEPPESWQPWFAIGIGLIAAAGGFAWLRWDAHYQNRRLANGDYDRYDLL